MALNQAAWLDGKDMRPLAVRAADMPKPGPLEVVVKNRAVAINPLDWKQQDSGEYVGTFPNVIGTDIAGEIYDVGSEVKNFKIGDRVLA
jgi:NADPH:quinone reductase-like Zn-dependent oxidoreductase